MFGGTFTYGALNHSGLPASAEPSTNPYAWLWSPKVCCNVQ